MLMTVRRSVDDDATEDDAEDVAEEEEEEEEAAVDGIRDRRRRSYRFVFLDSPACDLVHFGFWFGHHGEEKEWMICPCRRRRGSGSIIFIIIIIIAAVREESRFVDSLLVFWRSEIFDSDVCAVRCSFDSSIAVIRLTKLGIEFHFRR